MAEAGDAVDFYELRAAYLASPAFRSSDSHQLGALQDEMFQAMHDRDDAKVFEVAQKAISELYIDLDAHKARYQSCEHLRRADCAKYKAISLGLLRSVVRGRDGKTCATAWEVVRVSEEYFVARMLDMTVIGQRLKNDGHVCDALDVVDDHKVQSTLYFDVGAMLQASELRLRPGRTP